MISKLGMLGLSMLTFPSDAQAIGNTNQEFYQRCHKESFATAGSYCNKPFEIFLQKAAMNGRAGLFCLPVQPVSLPEYAGIYLRWVENNQERANEGLFQGINLVLGEAFPCNRE